MIEFRELRKSYGDVEALRGVSATIPGGQIVGLLGPNGAGKTTTMKILVGYLLPTSGSARVAGHDVVADPRAVQRAIGYLPENAPLYGEMAPRDYFRFVAEMRGLDARTTRARIDAVAAECGVADVLGRPIAQLSKGYRQRVGLAAAILHDPPILILDEPTTGLDPNQIVEVRDLIRRMGTRKTVILSTHILPEVEATCDRAILIYRGRIRADGTLDELTRSRTQVVELRADAPGEAEAALAALPGVAGSSRAPSADGFVVVRLELDEERDLGPAVFELAAARGWTLRELRRDDRTLEHVFRELTGVPEVAA